MSMSDLLFFRILNAGFRKMCDLSPLWLQTKHMKKVALYTSMPPFYIYLLDRNKTSQKGCDICNDGSIGPGDLNEAHEQHWHRKCVRYAYICKTCRAYYFKEMFVRHGKAAYFIQYEVMRWNWIRGEGNRHFALFGRFIWKPDYDNKWGRELRTSYSMFWGNHYYAFVQHSINRGYKGDEKCEQLMTFLVSLMRITTCKIPCDVFEHLSWGEIIKATKALIKFVEIALPKIRTDFGSNEIMIGYPSRDTLITVYTYYCLFFDVHAILRKSVSRFDFTTKRFVKTVPIAREMDYYRVACYKSTSLGEYAISQTLLISFERTHNLIDISLAD